jgi:plastocyanin
MWVQLTGLAAAVVLIVSCSSSTSPGGGGGGGHSTTITVSDNTFTPTPDTVSAGTVTFSWAGSNPHNVTWDSGPTPLPTNSVTQTSGSYSATLKAGTYQYHCVVHSSVMTGTLVVH